MKKLVVIQLTFFVMIFTSYSQNREMLKQKLADSQNNTDFLSWITTTKDIVDQDKKSEAEIDAEIDKVVQDQSAKSVLDIEVPINYKKLVFFADADIRKVILFNFNIFEDDKEGNYTDAANPKQIYRYGNLFIQTTNNSNRDQLDVYGVIRAYLIIKNKFPMIFNTLFSRTERTQFGSDVSKNINSNGTTYLNSNRNYIVTIHENNTKALSATTTNYGWGGNINNKAMKNGTFAISDNNNHFIFLNKATLMNGGASVGSNNIYNDQVVADREIKFLFDGLVQTIVHERMHNYIGNYQNVDGFLNYIRNDVSLLNGGKTYDYLEEPIVTNTTNQIFRQYSGISNEVMIYYTDLFKKTQLPKLQSISTYSSLLEKLRILQNTTSSDVENILCLNIFPSQLVQQQSLRVQMQNGNSRPRETVQPRRLKN